MGINIGGGDASGIVDGTIVNADVSASAAIAKSKLANGTADTLLGHNGSGVTSEVTVGSGLTLSSGTLSASGGGATLLDTITIDNTANIYTSNTFSTSYRDLLVVIEDVTSAQDGELVYVQVYQSTSGLLTTAGYATHHQEMATMTYAELNASVAGIRLSTNTVSYTLGSDTGEELNGYFYIRNYASTLPQKHGDGFTSFKNTFGTLRELRNQYIFRTAESINQLRIGGNTANFLEAGTVKIYGIN